MPWTDPEFDKHTYRSNGDRSVSTTDNRYVLSAEPVGHFGLIRVVWRVALLVEYSIGL
jgi:hypothetical protein